MIREMATTAVGLLMVVGGYQLVTGREFALGDAGAIPRWIGAVELGVAVLILGLLVGHDWLKERRR